MPLCWKIIFPWTSKMRRSNSLKISDDGWWMVLTTFTPRSASCLRFSITCSAVEESNPVVGSSKNSKLGFESSSTPIEVRFLSPPEIPFIKLFPIMVSAHLSKPNSAINSWTLWFFSSVLKSYNLRLAAKVNAYLGVKVGSKISSCITYAIWFAYGWRSFTCCPFKYNSPYIYRLSEASRPLKKLSRVVFPEPEGPIIAVNVPGLMIPFILFKSVLFALDFYYLPSITFSSIIVASISKFFHWTSRGFFNNLFLADSKAIEGSFENEF